MSTETTEQFLYRTIQHEVGKDMVHVKPVKEPPRLLVDAHMHIQSGRCSTLPFLRDQAPVLGDVGANRSTIEGIGKLIVGGVRRITKQSSVSTDKLGKAFLKEVDGLCQEFRSKDPYNRAEDFVFCGVVMTMDMEYAHLGGYFGLKIFNPIYVNETARSKDEKPICYWYPKPGTSGRVSAEGTVPANAPPERGETQQEFDALKRKREKEGVAGFIYDATGKKVQTVPIRCKIALTPKEESSLYENWKTQQQHTVSTVVEGKLKLLPMFHYDPRRWQEGDSLAFKEVGSEGLYLGFKMYTAQGYRPWDPRLPNLEGFYRECAAQGIPILNHCTPEGAPTYDRDQYIHFIHPADTATDGAQKQATISLYKDRVPVNEQMKDNWDYSEVSRQQAEAAATSYFNEHFVSPKAWRIVLEKHPNLRLCLAHFGGMTELGREWGLEIIKIMEEKKYPNFYADLSSSFADEKFRDHFKKLLTKHPAIVDQVLFGTDWYLTLLDKMDLLKFCSTAKDFLDSLDKKLWLKFSQENPYRFYRLGEQVGRIARNMLKEREKVENQEGSRGETWESEDAGREAEKVSKSYKTEVTKRAKLIQDIANTFVH